jgi:kynureninase
MDVIRQKATLLTGLLEHLLSDISGLRIISPLSPAERGSCLAIEVVGAKRSGSVPEYSSQLVAMYEALEATGIIVDKRAPSLMRLSPSPLYNTFEEVWRVAKAFRQVCQ